MGHRAGLPLRARGRKGERITGRDGGLEQLVLGGGLETGRAVGHTGAHKHKDQTDEDRAQCEAKSTSRQGGGIHVRCRAVGLAVASALGMRKEAVDMDAGLTCAVAAQLRNLGLALSSARAQAAILLRACARARTATLPCSACLLPRRRPGLLLRALRIAARGTSRRRRGAASKANALSPLITVVVSVCHSYRLVSCITCLSYKKDVQQMGLRVKSSVNGTKGAKHTVSKTSLYAPDERTPVGRAATMSGKPCRSSQKRRRSFCSSAFGRATSGAAVPRPYLKATK